jgi:hypothetical protein
VLFGGRPLRTRLDLVKPDLQMKMANRQIDQAGRKGHSPTRQLSIGQTVIACNHSGKDKFNYSYFVWPKVYQISVYFSPRGSVAKKYTRFQYNYLATAVCG